MIVILTESFGNHANRLWQDANLRAHCRDNSWHFFNPTIQNIWQDPSLGSRFKGLCGTMAYRLFRKLARWGLIRVEELGSTFLPEMNQPRGIKFVQGWAYRDEEAVRNHRKAILAAFTASRVQQRWAEEANQRLRSDIDCLVGIHIRRGDYRDWEGGRFYFSDEVYQGKLHELATQVGGRLGFVLFSNEAVDLEFFARTLPTVSFSSGTWQEDLLLMASCDYLVGPPSTFTMWASFLGNVPLYQIRDPQTPISLKDFRVYPQAGQ